MRCSRWWAAVFEGLGEARNAAEEALEELRTRDAAAKLFAADGSLWADDDAAAAEEIGGWIGWLPVVEEMRAAAPELVAWGREHGVPSGRYERVVLCGMGGSSLAPLVFAESFGLPIHVLDTTDPETVQAVPVDGSLFVISSKSGSTIEPSVMHEYFWEQTGQDGSRFVAVTDPGSKLGRTAREQGFLRVFENRADIGGRYSALSYFGLVPAVLAGLDIVPLLDGAAATVRASAPDAYPENPGLELGAVMGGLARSGRDKLTVVVSPTLASLGLWLEQLIAESTGKHGTGVVPLADEPLGQPVVYGADRLFVHVRVDSSHDDAVGRLEAAGQPVLTIPVAGPDALGAEMVRWELATAYAGALLGINPFDQPNVQAAKDLAVASLEAFEREGRLEESDPGDVAEAFAQAVPGRSYVAIQAFVPPTAANEALLQDVRRTIRDGLGVATSMGFGPRYLHSTGQLHKGGPPTGVFLQALSDSELDVPIPGRPFGFRTLIDAQSRGDAGALRAQGLPVARVPLSRLAEAVSTALQGATTTPRGD
ncbi:MAG: Glucose-6-phosphate isomerase [uncultured Thermoleophilia bacterium]|uniref:Glucose-6-phosphate isomerase n=1 Tax=uncultured Thermoleophilia bacterium TaxID=1497501 RepID=A0A6J4TYM1_9ACTN|nr:MAG: Glucose-6-phosphate isomerase [uncultured Thermoleophilia bacterium]